MIAVRWGIDLETLRLRLVENTLEPRFEDCGGFVHASERLPGVTSFFGNFSDVSAVFNIDTDEPDVVAELTELVRANLASPAYQKAKADHEAYQAQRIAEEAERRERARRGLR